MTCYRETSAESPRMSGAAGVKVPATRRDEFNADLAMNALVGFETAPADKPESFGNIE